MGRRTISIMCTLVMLAPSTLAQRKSKDIRMTWGLENTSYFREGKETSAGFVKFKTKPSRYYTFTNSNSVHGRLDDCAKRHFEMWSRYLKAYPDPKTRTQDGFQAVKRKSDPACFAYAQEVAPTLYFDFESANDDTYILKAIEVETFGFEEYAGGGFTDNEEWYDIVVPHTVGKKTYAVDNNKLSFKNKGRAQLRLWSDNYTKYANNGWITPMGAYLIRITFSLTHNGKESFVSTDPFQIDI